MGIFGILSLLCKLCASFSQSQLQYMLLWTSAPPQPPELRRNTPQTRPPIIRTFSFQTILNSLSAQHLPFILSNYPEQCWSPSISALNLCFWQATVSRQQTSFSSPKLEVEGARLCLVQLHEAGCRVNCRAIGCEKDHSDENP